MTLDYRILVAVSSWVKTLATFDCQKTQKLLKYFIRFHHTIIQILQGRTHVAVLVQVW